MKKYLSFVPLTALQKCPKSIELPVDHMAKKILNIYVKVHPDGAMVITSASYID